MNERGHFMGVYYQAPSAVVIGDVRIGEDASVWHGAIIRGDMEPITIGKKTNIQDGSILHVDTDHPLNIGDRCTVGHGVILHGCILEDDVLIGMGATVLNGARIGKGSLVGAGALVLEGQDIPAGSIVMGSPAKVRREVTQEQADDMARGMAYYVEEAKASLPAVPLNA